MSSVRKGHAAVLLLGALLPVVLSASEPITFDPVAYLEGKGAAPKQSVADIWANFKPSPNHDEIVAVSPDVWQTMPEKLDPKYRNPCWTDSKGIFRCIPFFHVLGVSKCGTTDIYARLEKHPEFATAFKGPHWWDGCVYGTNGCGIDKRPTPTGQCRPCNIHAPADFEAYQGSFWNATQRIKANPVVITGEASSNTFTAVHTFARGYQAERGLKVNLAQLMYEANPFLRFVVIFREPVSRYHSSFYYYRPDPKAPFESPELFHRRSVYEVKKWNKCLEAGYTKLQCIKSWTPQQMIKGMYVEFIEPWLKVFPREQFLFLRQDDYKRSQKEHLQVIFRFLGLRELREEEWPAMLEQEVANSQGKYPDMLPETYTLLQKFYRPFNRRLAEFFNDQRFTWADTYAAKDAAMAAKLANSTQGR